MQPFLALITPVGDSGGGSQPPGIWGPYPGFPTPPIANVPGLPPSGNPPGFGQHPEHPIYYPPGIWGPYPGFPSNPISGIPGLPGYEPPAEGQKPPFEAKVGWSPSTGWIVVYVPTGPTPTPSGGSDAK